MSLDQALKEWREAIREMDAICSEQQWYQDEPEPYVTEEEQRLLALNNKLVELETQYPQLIELATNNI